MSLSKRVGPNVKRLRGKLGITQAELARYSGLAVQQISKIENGASVRLETLDSLAKSLGVKPGELLT